MIRKMKVTDLDSIIKLWLKTNISTHNFITAEYWQEQYVAVKEQMLNTDIYIYEKDNMICGFIGIIDYYIAGLFVADDYQRKGIGKELLDYCKDKYSKLNLDVYVKNEKAIFFYLKNDFKIIETNTDKKNNEEEYRMEWLK